MHIKTGKKPEKGKSGELPMPKRIESPSSINTFKQCPRKYYYQYILKLPTLPNIHQVRGNIAHETLEKFYDVDFSQFTPENYSAKCRESIQQLLLFHWKKYQPELKSLQLRPDQERFYFEETLLMMMNWANQFLQQLLHLSQEKKISLQEAFQEITPLREQQFSSDVYSVQGFIDAIHRVGEEVHIIDYKTNNNFEFKDSIRLQLAIYSLLYLEKHGRAPNKVGIFFLRHKLKLYQVDEELLQLARREIELIHAHTSLSKEIHEYPKKVSPLCKWSSGQCDFYDTCKPHEKENQAPEIKF